jgi:uracil-DNA glycosylase
VKSSAAIQKKLDAHVAALRACALCPKMRKPVVSGGAVVSKVVLVGQAPGAKEPVLGRPFAWTAGKTLFGWFREHCGVDEAEFRSTVYMAAVCRCFPGKNVAGGDRVPDEGEVRNCATWLSKEFAILQPTLVIPVGKLAIRQFIEFDKLADVIGKCFPLSVKGHVFDMIPLPHPSGASPWHRIEPGKTFLKNAMRLIKNHSAFSGRV